MTTTHEAVANVFGGLLSACMYTKLTKTLTQKFYCRSVGTFRGLQVKFIRSRSRSRSQKKKHEIEPASRGISESVSAAAAMANPFHSFKV